MSDAAITVCDVRVVLDDVVLGTGRAAFVPTDDGHLPANLLEWDFDLYRALGGRDPRELAAEGRLGLNTIDPLDTIAFMGAIRPDLIGKDS